MTTPLQQPAVPAGRSSSRPLGWVVGFLIGWAATRAFSPAIAARLLGGMIAGFAVGLIPYLLARRAGDTKLAQRALLWCGVSGTALGIILAGPVALVFTVIALRRRPATTAE